MATNRCSICGLNWPAIDDYTTCPQCEEKTDYFNNVPSMNDEDARSMKLHLEFERYYAKYEAEKSGDGG